MADGDVRVGLKYEHIVAGLIPDRTYRFYTRIVNSVGVGPRSTPSELVSDDIAATAAAASA